MSIINKWEIVLIDLNPTKGSEINKTRPCLVVSPNSINMQLKTIVVIPLTSSIRVYPFRAPVRFQGVDGMCAVDHIRSISKTRIVKVLGVLSMNQQSTVSRKIKDFFM